MQACDRSQSPKADLANQMTYIDIERAKRMSVNETCLGIDNLFTEMGFAKLPSLKNPSGRAKRACQYCYDNRRKCEDRRPCLQCSKKCVQCEERKGKRVKIQR